MRHTAPTPEATHQRGARRVFRAFGDKLVRFAEPGSLRSVLKMAGTSSRSETAIADRVLMVGPRPGGGTLAGFTAWAATMPEGWAVAPAGHYLEGDHPTLRYVSPDGHEVHVGRAAQWLGDDALDASAADAEAAWVELGDAIRRAFDPRAQLLASPATTGRELWLRTIPRGAEWAPMSDELQHLCRSTSTQGRVELLPRAQPEVERIVNLDGRFMYAALCWGLAGGGAELVRCTEYLGQTRARYHVNVTVPRDWAVACSCGAPGHPGIGLLPRAGDKPRDGWAYPSEPGETFTTWADGAELHVALAHGWGVEPFEAIVWDGHDGVSPPLDAWAKRLVSARDVLVMRTARTPNGPGLPVPIGRMAAAGVRAILLHAVGAFHGARHRVTRSVPIEQAHEVPADARDMRVEGDRVVWAEHQAAAWPELAHPEWSTAIWARARARLLSGPGGTGALHVPARDVLAFRTDALYLTGEPPAWPDDGRAGRLRVVRRVVGSLATPRTHAELLAVVK